MERKNYASAYLSRACPGPLRRALVVQPAGKGDAGRDQQDHGYAGKPQRVMFTWARLVKRPQLGQAPYGDKPCGNCPQ
jgi:hypothetical protein